MTVNFAKFTDSPIWQRLPQWMVGILLVLLAYQLATLAWSWLSPPWQGAAGTDEALVVAPSKQRAKVDMNAIANSHLFGKLVIEQAKVAEPISAPETRLKLELRGVISTDAEGGSAIIADDRRNEQYYSVGDELPGNASLHEVHPDRVILERSGRYETLSLPQELKGDTALENASATSPGGAGVTSPEVAELLRDYRSTLNTNPQQLMGLVNAVPVMRNNSMVGFRVSPGRDRSLMGKFGLRPGDVVTEVNGVALTSAANGLSLMQQLSSAQSLSVQIERNGRPMTLDFQVD